MRILDLGIAAALGVGCHAESEGVGSLHPSGCPALRSIERDVTIESGDQLTDLQCVERIDGDLTIRGTSLHDLTDLQYLAQVDGLLTVEDNVLLRNLDGLDDLRTIGGVSLIRNGALVDLDALQHLQQIGSSGLSLMYNSSLPNLDGLSSLQRVDGSVIIGGTEWLDCYECTRVWLNDIEGLQSIVYIGGSLSIFGVPRLTTVDGLRSIEEVQGNVYISDNLALEHTRGLNQLERVGGSLTIGHWFGNHSLHDLGGFPSLQEVGGTVEIMGYGSLHHISGFDVLKSVGGDILLGSETGWSDLETLDAFHALEFLGGGIHLRRMERLTSLTGFSSLESVSGSFSISGGEVLESIGGFDSLTEVGGLWVDDMPSLRFLPGFARLTRSHGFLSITGHRYGRLEKLESLSDLSNLEHVGGVMSIERTALTSLAGLQRLQSVEGGCRIESNGMLPEEEVEDLETQLNRTCQKEGNGTWLSENATTRLHNSPHAPPHTGGN